MATLVARGFVTMQSATRSRDYVLEVTPRKRLDDLCLSEICDRACRDLIEEQQRASLLRSHSLEPRHRVLLVGPPGNGKTSLAEALAEALAYQFFVVRYDAIIGSFLGETASRLRHVFDYARTTPCVLFFDEFDAVGKERGDVNETGEIKRVVTSLLMQVDDLPSYTVVVTASNHPELLDRAVWRRFQLRLELPAPTRAEIGRYFEAFSSRMDKPLGNQRGNAGRVPRRDQLCGSGGILLRPPPTTCVVVGREALSIARHRTIEAVGSESAPTGHRLSS